MLTHACVMHCPLPIAVSQIIAKLTGSKQQPFLLCPQVLWVKNLDRAQRGWLVTTP